MKIVDQFWATHTGRQRSHNEDSYYAAPPVFVIADGMGGAQAGEVASDMVVTAFKSGLPPDGSPEEKLTAVIRAANELIHESAHADRERAGMGTTVAAAYLADHEVSIAHVGDARAYLFRADELMPLTRDHTLVQVLLDQERITPEEAAVHPQRSIITRAVGPEPQVDVETQTIAVQPGDVLLLCSDGLTSMVDEAKIAEILRSTGSLRDGGRSLIDAANEAGGRDNITVILFRLGEDDDPVEAADDRETTMVHDAVEPRPDKPQTAFMPALGGAAAEQAAPRRRLQPRRPVAEPATKRKRRSRRWIAPVAVVCVLAVVVGGLWIASRAVYFLGTDSQGFVTIYRGVPYDLPFGIHLYERFYTSGVPAEIVPATRRSKLLDHTWRSQNDAVSLVNQLELGKLSR
jgi:serine/threonine protein phosphatase PrpC